MNILYILLIFVISIIFHEVGHLIAAKAAGKTIYSIDIGVGKNILSFSLRGVNIRINLFLFGGRVSVTETEEYKWRGILFPLGGPLANVFLAVLSAFIATNVLGINPVYREDATNTVGFIVKDSKFDRIGIEPGNTIISINGKNRSVTNFMTELFYEANNDIYNISFEKNGNIIKSQLELSQSDSRKILPMSTPYSENYGVVKSIYGEKAYSGYIKVGSVESPGYKDIIFLFTVKTKSGEIISFKDIVTFDLNGNFSLPFLLDEDINILELLFDRYRSVKDLNLYKSSFLEGAKILKVNNKSVDNAKDLEHMINNPEVPVDFIKDGKENTIYIPIDGSDVIDSEMYIDISKKLSIDRDIKEHIGFIDLCSFYFSFTIRMLYRIIAGSRYAVKSILSPYTLMSANNMTHIDSSTITAMIILLNIQWAIINMFPLYFLDGGNIIAQIIRKIFSKKFHVINYYYFILSFAASFVFLAYKIIVNLI